MSADFVKKVVPNADADFIRILSRLELSQSATDRFKKFLPMLHDFFLKKRDAVSRGDWNTFDTLLREETMLIGHAVA